MLLYNDVGFCPRIVSKLNTHSHVYNFYYYCFFKIISKNYSLKFYLNKLTL